MRGRQSDLRCGAFFMRLQKTRRAKAPFIARFQPDEAVFGARCGKIVAQIFRQRQKFCRHHRADGVHAPILWAGVTASVAEKSRDGRRGAGLERAPKNVDRRFFHKMPFCPAKSCGIIVRQWLARQWAAKAQWQPMAAWPLAGTDWCCRAKALYSALLGFQAL